MDAICALTSLAVCYPEYSIWVDLDCVGAAATMWPQALLVLIQVSQG